MKLNRRKTVLGLGAMATGSGAVFSSAAFSSDVDASSDMRVVVEEDLIVEAGAAFRDASDNYDSTLDPTGDGKFAGTDNSDFFANTDPGTDTEEDLGNDLDPDDAPAVFVNDLQNQNLEIKLATPLDDTTYTFNDFLRVKNETASQISFGIKFQEFGADTTGNQDSNGGNVNEASVVNDPTTAPDKGIYELKDSNGDQISTDGGHFDTNSISSVDNQQVYKSVDINAGTKEQISLEVDFTASSIRNSIKGASSASGNPFNTIEDTVQLVDALRFGQAPSATTQ